MSETLIYSNFQPSPEELLNFWELEWFCRSWDECGLTDDDLACLQLRIMSDPKAPPVMRGTSGLRKMRFSPESWPAGKSGALRVCYVYFERYGLVLLCLVFKKGQMDNISAAGKQAINHAIERIEQRLLQKFGF